MNYNNFTQSALFAWSPPSVKNGIVNTYKLSVQFEGGPLQIFTVNNATTRITFTVNRLCRKYTATVSATTGGGTGPNKSVDFLAIPISISYHFSSFTK